MNTDLSPKPYSSPFQSMTTLFCQLQLKLGHHPRSHTFFHTPHLLLQQIPWLYLWRTSRSDSAHPSMVIAPLIQATATSRLNNWNQPLTSLPYTAPRVILLQDVLSHYCSVQDPPVSFRTQERVLTIVYKTRQCQVCHHLSDFIYSCPLDHCSSTTLPPCCSWNKSDNPTLGHLHWLFLLSEYPFSRYLKVQLPCVLQVFVFHLLNEAYCDHSFFFFFCPAAQLVGSSFPDQGSNPGPLQWKHGVLTTGPPGNSQPLFLKLQPCFLLPIASTISIHLWYFFGLFHDFDHFLSDTYNLFVVLYWLFIAFLSATRTLVSWGKFLFSWDFYLFTDISQAHRTVLGCMLATQ